MNPLSYALLKIKKRWYSVWEIEQELKKKGFAQSEVDYVISDLKEKGLLNDLRFAQAWIHDRDLFSPKGNYLLRKELVDKGISLEDINLVLLEREKENPDIESQMALRVLKNKSGNHKYQDKDKEKRLKTDLLLRRGFSFDLIRRILDV